MSSLSLARDTLGLLFVSGESANFQIDMFGKRGQNRSKNGQPMGVLSQEKKAKLEGEDEAKFGTGTSSNDVIERGDVNQERSMSELQIVVNDTQSDSIQ